MGGRADARLSGTEDGFLFSGYWPSGLYARGGRRRSRRAGLSLAVSQPDDGPASYFAVV